jgi:formamidopyrimidine-DNA glycosylase
MAFELPEAMIVAEQMRKELRGKQIASIEMSPRCDTLIRQGFISIQPEVLPACIIRDVQAGGKWIFLTLSNEYIFALALETKGYFLYSAPGMTPEECHVRLRFSDESILSEYIVGWGWAKLLTATQIVESRFPGPIGISPLDIRFTYDLFNAFLRGAGHKPVRKVLTQQDLIGGIGGGYLQDILFTSHISPMRRTDEIADKESRILYESIKMVMQEALNAGGNNVERDLYGKPGTYMRRMGGHLKGRMCPECGKTIVKAGISGANLYMCPGCQK